MLGPILLLLEGQQGHQEAVEGFLQQGHARRPTLLAVRPYAAHVLVVRGGVEPLLLLSAHGLGHARLHLALFAVSDAQIEQFLQPQRGRAERASWRPGRVISEIFRQ